MRSVFISGGAGGIGLATARAFRSRGWRVGIGDRDPAALARVDASTGVATFVHDVRDPAAWDTVLDAFCAPSDGALDVLVNNAGVLDFGWFDEQDVALIDRAVDVNVKGVMYGAQAAVRRLPRGVNPRLVNIASAAALVGSPRLAIYSATKFAVRGLSEALDIEFMRLGVRVVCVEPFLVDTPMLDSEDVNGINYRDAAANLGVLSVSEIAETILAAVDGDRLHVPVGMVPTADAASLHDAVELRRSQWWPLLTKAEGGGA